MEFTGKQECSKCGHVYKWMHYVFDDNVVAITYIGRTTPDINVSRAAKNGIYYVIVTKCPECGEKYTVNIDTTSSFDKLHSDEYKTLCNSIEMGE